MSALKFLQPPGWPRPKGYANGIAAAGETIFVGGQIGWDAEGRFAEGLPAQIGQTLANILAVLAEAGAGPADITRLTWYLVEIEDYMAHQAEIGAAYRRILGRHFPVMAVVQVVRLVERQALVEIEATAVKPA